jgi:hypothetical protein
MTKLYKTTFCVRLVENGRRMKKPVVVRCSDDDFFFYNLLTKGMKCGILDHHAANYAETDFFFNGYNWIDGGPLGGSETTEDGA